MKKEPRQIPCPVPSVTITKRDRLHITMAGPLGNETLQITGEYPETDVAESLFDWLGTMHLVAPYLPREILTNFGIPRVMRQLIDDMYQSEKQASPVFISPRNRLAHFAGLQASSGKAISSHSGGKDSLWNTWRAQNELGRKNVLAVHIGGLNRSNASGERRQSLKQSKKLGFEIRVVELRNGSVETGFKVMRSRDMFMMGIIIPIALEFGASQIITEGFGEGNAGTQFTGQEKNLLRFSRDLKRLGIPVQVVWKNAKEMDVVRGLAENAPEWLALTHNCFAPECYKIGINASWRRRTPTFVPKRWQCGSCIKCRIIRLAQLAYGKNGISKKDAILFLKNTASWIPQKWPTHSDMIDGSFLVLFKELAGEYGVKFNFQPATTK